MTTIGETGAKWIAVASECGCGHVAVWLNATDVCDPNAPAEADGDHEVVAYGDDWRDLVRRTAAALHQRTGLPISGRCTVVCTKDVPEWRRRGKCSPLEEEVTGFICDELDNRRGRN